jgi:uncharacterized phage infection (PIP) family protein YhgE
MELTPYYGDQPLVVQSVQVRVNPKDQKRADALLNRTSGFVSVFDSASFATAQQLAGQLKAFLNEIDKGRKGAQEPFKSINEQINEQARLIGDSVGAEHKRILGLLNAYVAELEARQKEQDRKHAEALAREREAHDAKIRAALAAQEAAEEKARAALDEAARIKAQAEAQAQMLVAAQEQLAKEMAMEVANLGADQPRRGLVPSGRVDHPFEFKLLNLGETVRAGCLGLLRWELNIQACQDSVRAQLAIDPNCTPSLPGIQVKRSINVSVKANAKGLL